MKTALIVFMIIVFVFCAFSFQNHAPYILNHIKNLGWLGPLFFLLFYCLATILLLPTMVLTLAGGALFGPILGTILNLTGATFGAACAFCISRYLAHDWFSTKRGPKTNKLIQGVDKRGWQFVALLRLAPIVPFNLVNYGLGVTHIKFSHYFLTTLIFLAPAEIIYTYCGYAGMDAIINPRSLYSYSMLLLSLAFCLIVLLIIKIKYRQQETNLRNQKSFEH